MSKKNISDEDQALFREAMKTVTPLIENKRIITPLKRTTPTQSASFKKEAAPYVRALQNISYVDPVFAESVLSSLPTSMPSRQKKAFVKGELSYEKRLDLHGLTLAEAHEKLILFIETSIQAGYRYLLIIHGKGNHSKAPPVLKNYVNEYLRSHPNVFAFNSAQERDGGTGAVYVLLKKNRAF